MPVQSSASMSCTAFNNWHSRQDFGGMAEKPVVLSVAYTGDENWDEWLDHFSNVAAVNK